MNVEKELVEKELDEVWEKMSLTKCWKFATKEYKPQHLKDMIYYWLLQSTLDDGDSLEIGSLLNTIKKYK